MTLVEKLAGLMSDPGRLAAYREESEGRDPLLIWLGILDRDRDALPPSEGEPRRIALDSEIAEIEARLGLE